MFELSNLPKTVTKSKKRVGRGEGSNRGKNAGKGHKGQNKHGQGVRIGFEGGQKSLLRRTPKFRGFKPLDRNDKVILTLGTIDKVFLENETVSLATLLEKGLINKYTKIVRIVSTGSLSKKISFVEEESLYLTKGVKSVLNQ